MVDQNSTCPQVEQNLLQTLKSPAALLWIPVLQSPDRDERRAENAAAALKLVHYCAIKPGSYVRL